MVHKVKNVMITGANRGIGLELVKQMLTEFQPDHLIATYRKPENSGELLELAQKHGNLHPVQMDATNYDELPNVVAQVEKLTEGAGINLLINNSGIFLHDCNGIRDITREDILAHVETNTISPVLIAQAFLPLLEKAAATTSSEEIGIKKATLINISTLMASIADNTSGASFSYRVSKTALNMATKCISHDLSKSGILTTLIHPGWVRTDMGGSKAPLSVEQSVKNIVQTLTSLTLEHNGKFLNYDGKELLW